MTNSPTSDAPPPMIPKTTLAAVLVVVAALAMLAHAEDKPAPLAFGTARTSASDRSFGGGSEKSPSKDRSSERDRAYARGLLKKYDANKDRVLQEDEWRKIRGTPEKADSNGDGRITYVELVARVTNKRREREVSKEPEGQRRSYRLAVPKLPEGLPGWFSDRDANGDGQVAMHEYSRRWTDSTARRFVKLDKNDDGLITPDEALE